MIAAETIARLKEAAGPGGFLEGTDTQPFCTPFRDGEMGATPLVLRPNSTERVAALVAICAATGTPVVPQGGNTGLTGAGLPHGSGAEVVLSLGRMNRIRAIDPLNDTIAVDAGVTMAAVQVAAEEADRLFPLSIGARGTCQIGGNLSTNAGGIHVVRYGNARAMVLGLEVVTGQGEVWDGMRGLRKDNAGYDLKQLFVGAEGTLGVITGAVLKLWPRPRERQTALAEVPDPAAGIALLAHMKALLGEAVSAFELIHVNCFRLATETLGLADPMAADGDWRVLMDVTGQEVPGSLSVPLEEALGTAVEAGLVSDAVIASSGAQAEAIWAIREEQAEVQRRAGYGIKHDISVPVSSIPAFIEKADAALRAVYPDHVTCTFGHAGDGNLHYNPIEPPGWGRARWEAETGAVNRIVHDVAAGLGGSITAEHGVGRLRKGELAHYKAPVELEMMRAVKRVFDPAGIMNPGKVFDI